MTACQHQPSSIPTVSRAEACGAALDAVRTHLETPHLATFADLACENSDARYYINSARQMVWTWTITADERDEVEGTHIRSSYLVEVTDIQRGAYQVDVSPVSREALR